MLRSCLIILAERLLVNYSSWECLQSWEGQGTESWSALTHLCLPQQLLELVLGQQPVVLHEGWHLGWPLCLIVNCAMDLHVLVEDGQELLLALGRKADVNYTKGWI